MPCPMINRFVLMGQLGKGTFGTVRCAVDVLTMTPYAVKLIDKVTAREKLLSLSVRKEVAIMQSLQHPNVVKLVGVFSDSRTVYIVMNLVTGGELFREVKRLGRMSEPYARFFFQQLVRGLEYCHNRGVFHRDLKPENLLLDTDNTLKITDFGLSTLLAFPGSLLAEEQLLRTRCGTPHYVAPEILTMPSEGYDGAKTDVWSCGVILYVLVGGGLPFDDHTTPDSQPDNMDVVFRKIIRGDIMYPRHFSDDLVDLLENIFKEDPNDRFGLKDIARHSWFSGIIVTQEKEESRDSFSKQSPGVSEILERNIEELMPHYEKYRRKAEEKLNRGGKRTEQHAVSIIKGPNGLPLPTVVEDPRKFGGPNVSIDSLALGSVQESRDIGLQYANEASGSGDISDTEGLVATPGKLGPGHIRRGRAESFGFESQKSVSSEDDNNIDFDSAFEIGDDLDHSRNCKAGSKVYTDHFEIAQSFYRSRSAGSVKLMRSPACNSSFGNFDGIQATSPIRVTERFRVDLWDGVGVMMQTEPYAAHVHCSRQSVNVRPFAITFRPSSSEVRSNSFGGPFGNSSVCHRHLETMLAKKGNLGSLSGIQKGNPHSNISLRSRVVSHFPSLLATAPVVFASCLKDSPCVRDIADSVDVNYDKRGHEWKPFEHHDNLLWCRMVRDYDMIPDLEEFGFEGSELNSAWKTQLGHESCTPKSSVPAHFSTTFHLSRSSVEMSTPAWREKSRKWIDVPTSLAKHPKISSKEFGHNHSYFAPQLVEHDQSVLLRPGDPGAVNIRPPENSCDSFEVMRPPVYSNISAEAVASRCRQIHRGRARIIQAEPCSFRTAEARNLLQFSSNTACSVQYTDMPVQRSRTGEMELHSLSITSCGSIPNGPATSSPRQIATGPLRKGYGSSNSQSSGESSGNGHEQAELKAQNLFRLAIPGPEFRPPLPEPRPLSKVLKPTVRVVRQFLSPKILSVAKSGAYSFKSLVEMDRCRAIVTDVLERYGCVLSSPEPRGGQFRTPVLVNKPNMILSVLVSVVFREPELTEIRFSRKAGDQAVFTEFFNQIRVMHATACAVETGSS